MKKRFGGTILNVSVRLIVPFSMMYAIYVFAAGESGPGGGFQAGAVLALASSAPVWSKEKPHPTGSKARLPHLSPVSEHFLLSYGMADNAERRTISGIRPSAFCSHGI